MAIVMTKPVSATWLLWAVLLAFVLPVGADVGEHELKAAFIGKFVPFIQWPVSTASEFRLCSIGRMPQQREALKKLVQLTLFDGRSATFVAIDQPAQLQECDLLFIGTVHRLQLAQIRDHSRANGVLTVADTPGFAAQGIMINFVRQNGRIRFEINVQAAQAAGLKISSRLLKLAVAIPALARVEEEVER